MRHRWVPRAVKLAGIGSPEVAKWLNFDFTNAAIMAMQRDYCLSPLMSSHVSTPMHLAIPIIISFSDNRIFVLL